MRTPPFPDIESLYDRAFREPVYRRAVSVVAPFLDEIEPPPRPPLRPGRGPERSLMCELLGAMDSVEDRLTVQLDLLDENHGLIPMHRRERVEAMLRRCAAAFPGAVLRIFSERAVDLPSAVVGVLTDVPDGESVELLCALLEDPRACVRSEAARALGVIGDARAVGPLVGALCDPWSVVEWMAAEALGSLRASEAIEPLSEVLYSHHMAERATQALARIGGPRALDALQRGAEADDPLVSTFAVDAMRSVGSDAVLGGAR